MAEEVPPFRPREELRSNASGMHELETIEEDPWEDGSPGPRAGRRLRRGQESRILRVDEVMEGQGDDRDSWTEAQNGSPCLTPTSSPNGSVRSFFKDQEARVWGGKVMSDRKEETSGRTSPNRMLSADSAQRVRSNSGPQGPEELSETRSFVSVKPPRPCRNSMEYHVGNVEDDDHSGTMDSIILRAANNPPTGTVQSNAPPRRSPSEQSRDDVREVPISSSSPLTEARDRISSAGESIKSWWNRPTMPSLCTFRRTGTREPVWRKSERATEDDFPRHIVDILHAQRTSAQQSAPAGRKSRIPDRCDTALKNTQWGGGYLASHHRSNRNHSTSQVPRRQESRCSIGDGDPGLERRTKEAVFSLHLDARGLKITRKPVPIRSNTTTVDLGGVKTHWNPDWAALSTEDEVKSRISTLQSEIAASERERDFWKEKADIIEREQAHASDPRFTRASEDWSGWAKETMAEISSAGSDAYEGRSRTVQSKPVENDEEFPAWI